jgi:hypothetical protein
MEGSIADPMTSTKKITANRANARKSTGPRTLRGKASASRNALRHGLATIQLPELEVSSRIKRIAKKIVGDNAGPAQYEQAVIIAESEIMLLNVRAASVAIVKLHGSAGPTAIDPVNSIVAELGGGAKVVSEKGMPNHSFDDLDATRRALPELMKLERYERRAMARRRRAIRRLMVLRASA